MGLFDTGAGITSTLGAASNAVGAFGNGINVAGNLGSALSNFGNVTSAEGVGSAIRSLNLPAAGEALGDVMGAISEFGGDANANDWRVRLSLPKWVSFKSSPVLTPLKDAGGLIFPYTPTIAISGSANYSTIDTTHTNYTFRSFKSSDPGSISITAPMFVEDSTQGLYWVAAVHYLRSLTKMFAGSDPKAGNPPPIVFLNGYGNYVFKNIPVVITSFSVQLDGTSDYIGCDVVGSAAGELEGIADSVGGLADTLGGAIGGSFSGVTSTISSIAGGVGQVASLLGTFGVGGTTNGGVTHVPTKSSFSVTLQPIYSRNSARNFSLDRFVQGGYLSSSFGYA
jgi:hypothetical protein